MTLNDECVFVSIHDLTGYIEDLLVSQKQPVNEENILVFIRAIIEDFFSKNNEEEYLDRTLMCLERIKVPHAIRLEIAMSLYNHFLFIVDTYRPTENLDYLDHLYYDILSIHLIKLSYAKYQKTPNTAI